MLAAHLERRQRNHGAGTSSSQTAQVLGRCATPCNSRPQLRDTYCSVAKNRNISLHPSLTCGQCLYAEIWYRDELISDGSGLGEMRNSMEKRGSAEGRVPYGMSSGQLSPVIA